VDWYRWVYKMQITKPLGRCEGRLDSWRGKEEELPTLRNRFRLARSFQHSRFHTGNAQVKAHKYVRFNISRLFIILLDINLNEIKCCIQNCYIRTKRESKTNCIVKEKLKINGLKIILYIFLSFRVDHDSFIKEHS
jgi:hypothetical protein